MSSIVASASQPGTNHAEGDVSLPRLYVLRATYFLLVIGLGLIIVPTLINHELMTRGAIPSLLGGVWLLSFIGLKYPRQMLPLLMFEFAWKTIWLLAFGLPQGFAGQMPPTFPDDFESIAFGVILMPIVIPWPYVWRHYAKAPGDRWRGSISAP